jgi:hypothetical protein
MATLGALWSQQLGFTVTTTTGTIYTHALGYTPTVIILTPFGTNVGTQGAPFYTLAGTNLITIGAASAVTNVDVTVGSFHSLIK